MPGTDEYTLRAEDPRRWLDQAWALEFAANVLFEAQHTASLHSVWQESEVSEEACLQTMQLLAALAIENACKAVLVAECKIVVQEGRLAGAHHKSHNLVALARAAGLEAVMKAGGACSESTLSDLTEVAFWAGRYVVPLKQVAFSANPSTLGNPLDSLGAAREISQAAWSKIRDLTASST